MSLYVTGAAMDLDSVWATAGLAAGDYAKDQGGFAEYYDSFGFVGFYGTLTTMTTTKMVKVKFSGPRTGWSFDGAPNIMPFSLTLNAGWTWLPCPWPTAVDMAANMPSTYSWAENDLIKSQNGFATYYATAGFTGWYGPTLPTIDPGKGYKVSLQGSGTLTFNQGVPAASGRRLAAPELLLKLESL